jgi:nicotinate-nucleotide--dimethylbenzimidazole phosphoribosyltransferase
MTMTHTAHWLTQEAAQRAIDAKTKPLGALGRLEEVAVRLALLQQTLTPSLDRACICVFGADHGVADEGVSAYPRAVTAEMMKNFDRGGAAINVIARANGIEVEVVDVGVDADLTAHRSIRHAKVRRGSRNLATEAAMTAAELADALAVGAASVEGAARRGVRAIGFGEMGIGNTTAAAAVLAVLTGQPSLVTVGRGTGVSDEALFHKRAVVDRALALHATSVGRLDAIDAREALRRVGGLELAAIAGATIEGARRGLAIVADGFISTVSVLAAIHMAAADSTELLAALRGSLFFAHRSTELGHGLALDACAAVLGARVSPLLDFEMRLGEGTGAALAIPLLRSAAAVMCDMATFASAGVSAGEHADEHAAPQHT